MMRMLTTNSEAVEGMTDQNRNSAFESFLDPLPEVTVQPSAGDSKAEREQRSLALEKTYVYDVYEQIAPHVIESRHRPWPKIRQFLVELEPGSLVCDVGCGNGKYLNINQDIYKIGSDQCYKLAEGAKELGHDVLACDNMALPFREESFDAVLSVAVVHHFATTERRVQALRELARILRIGGRLMITAWALEQRHRKFESQDVLVPWHKPKQSSSEDQTSLDKEITSTTTSDDDLLNYHAYTSGMESEPYFVPTCYPRRRHKLREGWAARHHHRGRTLDSRHSSSQSSSDLSSPNETCYSFVRRALQKLSSGKSWDDPHQRCRPPWFLQSVDSTINGNGAEGVANDTSGEKQDSLDSNENADDIPIELHDVDSSDICEEFGEIEQHQKCKESACRKYSLQQNRSNFEDSNTKSQSAKHLKRSSSGDSPPPPKSKSLSDILSLFAVNFSYSRKSSQDSTSRSSSSSLTKHSSSSSVDSKSATTKHGRSTHHPLNGCVVRSKSSHFTLAKVDEDNEQNAPQMPGPATPSQQRWSVAGYPSCEASAKANESCSRRPRSLVLERDVHIPRTLSAEDHKNGNTILPDLDSCLTFYGLTAGMKDEDFLSPPYTKAESYSVVPDKCQPGGSIDEVTVKQNREATSNRDVIKNGRNASLTQRLDAQSNGAKYSETRSALASEIFSATSGPKADNSNRTLRNVDTKASCLRNRKSFDMKDVPVLDSVKKDAWKDIFYNNLIKQIIDREHLFPYHSMPNLGIESCMSSLAGLGSDVETSFAPDPHYQRYHCQRRFSQPYTSLQQITLFDKTELEFTSKDKVTSNEASRNGFKKRSFSVDVDQRTLANSSSLEGMAMTNAKGILVNPKNRCLIRRRSCMCSCPGDVKSIKHSRSVGDSTFPRLQSDSSSSCTHTVKVGNNKIIAKEDSLQSDTSVDSDDSVASVIAVRRNPSLDMPSCSPGPSERHYSTCSKDSSNLSDTSVDSEESCVSVIAMPLRRLENLDGDQENESLEDSCHMANTLGISTPTSEAQSRPKLRCCRQKSLELENFVPEDDGTYNLAARVLEDSASDNATHCIYDPVMTSEEFYPEPAITSDNSFPEPAIAPQDSFQEYQEFGQRMKTCISWEKYLDACESLVLDSIFYVNATHADFTGERSLGITHLVPDVYEQYENSIASVQFLNSEIPLTAETCWLDPAGSWKSSESLENCSDSGDLSSLMEDQLDEELKLEIVEGNGSSEWNSPNFPPGSPQGRLLEAAVHVANSLQSAMTMAVTSGDRRREHNDRSFQTAAADPRHSSLLCASKETASSLPEDQETVGSSSTTILSESRYGMMKSDYLPSRLTVHEVEIMELDENLDNALDSEMSDCIGPSFEMPSDEEEGFPECFEDLPDSIVDYRETERIFTAVEKDGSDVKASREDLTNIMNVKKCQEGWLNLEMLKSVDGRDIQKCVADLPNISLDAKDNLHSAREAVRDCSGCRVTSKVADDNPSKELANILHLKKRQGGKLGLEMLNDVDRSFQRNSTCFAKDGSGKKCRKDSEFRATFKTEDGNPSKNIKEDLRSDELDANVTIADAFLNPATHSISDTSPLASSASASDSPKELISEEQSLDSIATKIFDCSSENAARAIELRDLKNFKDGHLTERSRRIREDVINGNVPGHRELLKKMVQEWGHGWLEFQTCDAVSGLVDLEDKGQKRRRKSESEAIDLNVRLESRVSNVGNISRGRSMEFNAMSPTSCRKAILCEEMIPAANKSAAIKLSTSVQYRIQEEEECMTKSNDSSDLSIAEPLNSAHCCTLENMTMASSVVVFSTLETSIVSDTVSGKEPDMVSKQTDTCNASTTGCFPKNGAYPKGENMVKISSVTEPAIDSQRVSSVENNSVNKGTKTWTGSPPGSSAMGSKRDSPADSNATSKETELMQTSMASSIENHFGKLEFLMLDLDGNEVMSNTGGCPTQQGEQTELPTEQENVNDGQYEEEGQPESLSLSTSEDSILSGSENGGSTTYHRFYHVFREGELDHLIEKYVENLHIISSYYDHANWCIIAEKVQVWRI